MCGIIGANFLSAQEISELNNLQIHRGPDQSGVFFDNNIALAHRRLSILDLSENGKQPMVDRSGDNIIVFNGEIYNFKEIRSELISKGYSFFSNADTEVILNSYIEWGRDCLEKFNGQFAFSIYDKKKSILFLARDRMGIKPLYYYCNGNRFMFSSELKGILRSGIDRDVNSYALEHYFILGYTPLEQSIVSNVNKLEPATYLIYDLDRKAISEKRKYWDITAARDSSLADNYEVDVYDLLDEAVKKRLIADVPVGAFLSGGVDSSIIVYFMSKYISNLKTFSVKFDYNDFDESKWARVISDKFGTEHHEIEFTAKDVEADIPALVNSFDEPFGDTSMIPTYLVSKVAKKHVTVCLSGTGGDELFAGYTRYKEYLMLKKLTALPSGVKKLLTKSYSLLNSDKAKKLGVLLREKDDVLLYLKLFSYLFRDDGDCAIELNQFYSRFKSYFIYNDSLSNILNFDQVEYLANDLLVKEDRAALGVSLEGRIPFLDHNLVEYVNGKNNEMSGRGILGKKRLKQIFSGKLPEEILYRKKKGFGVPIKYYFMNELKDFAFSYIFTEGTYKYFKKEYLEKIWNNHQKGHSDYSRFFWVIIMYNMWRERWMV